MNDGRRSVLVTGANGFIGSALCNRFEEAGWNVVASGRHKPAHFAGTIAWRDYDLTWPALPKRFLDGIDVVVHAALARDPARRNDFAINVAGSTLLFDEAQVRGIERIVFLSSLAAHDAALSSYGRQKYAIEQLVAARGGLVVRPGLVLGPGGSFGAMCAYLETHRFVPLFAGGGQPLQTVYAGDLVGAVTFAVASDVRGVYTAAEAAPVTYRSFYEALSRAMGSSAVFLPVPFWAAEAAVAVAARAGVALPIDADTLLGLKAMRVDKTPQLEAAGFSFRPYSTNIQLALADMRGRPASRTIGTA
jgi:nucleoside-diphosphate-sugar epimerase